MSAVSGYWAAAGAHDFNFFLATPCPKKLNLPLNETVVKMDVSLILTEEAAEQRLERMAARIADLEEKCTTLTHATFGLSSILVAVIVTILVFAFKPIFTV